MASIDDLLRRWQDAGLIDRDTARRIIIWEDQQAPQSERPGVVEALVYLGLAVIGVGVAVLVGSNWEHLATAARIAIPAAAAVVALVAGWIMLDSVQPELRRGGQAAWLLAFALTVGTAGIACNEADMDGKNIILVVALVGLAASIPLWLWSKTHFQVIGVGAAGMLVSLAITSRFEDAGPEAFGLPLAGVALAGLIVTELNILRPQLTARALATVGLVFGGFYSGIDGPIWAEAVSFVVAALLITLSIRLGLFGYMAAGVAAVFIGLVTAILRHIDEPTYAALALIATGVLLIAGIVVLERFRPWAQGRTHGSGKGAAPTVA
ncbi:MAG TPA: DUF2157 domain-containing protein [Tepidiformaceae bacterium]|nr:DUF2157 domain-containing protein [Tepidiformaceae bacterium]